MPLPLGCHPCEAFAAPTHIVLSLHLHTHCLPSWNALLALPPVCWMLLPPLHALQMNTSHFLFSSCQTMNSSCFIPSKFCVFVCQESAHSCAKIVVFRNQEFLRTASVAKTVFLDEIQISTGRAPPEGYLSPGKQLAPLVLAKRITTFRLFVATGEWKEIHLIQLDLRGSA